MQDHDDEDIYERTCINTQHTTFLHRSKNVFFFFLSTVKIHFKFVSNLFMQTYVVWQFYFYFFTFYFFFFRKYLWV